MKGKWVIGVIVLVLVLVIVAMILGRGADGNEGDRRLSREEQVQIMEECYRDGQKTYV